MSGSESGTLEAILSAAKAEFLEKGFKSASLRNIVKTAGVTTGAFYGYYKSKEELFDALAARQYETVMEKFTEAQEVFAGLPIEKQRDNMGKISGDCMEWITEYIYKNFDVFKLILTCSEGTRYENMIHDMVEIEVGATHRFAANMRRLGLLSLIPVVLGFVIMSAMTGKRMEEKMRQYYKIGSQKGNLPGRAEAAL